MAVTFIDYAQASTSTSPLTVSWNSGSGQPDGSLMLAVVEGASSAAPIKPPTGWNVCPNCTNSNGAVNSNQSACAFYKYASSEGATESWDNTTTGSVLAVTLVSFSGALGIPQVAHTTGTATPVATGTITPNETGSMVVAGFTTGNSITAVSTSSSPACTLRATVTQGGGRTLIIETQNALSTLAATTAIPATLTGTLTAWNGYQFVIQPQPAALVDTISAVSDAITFTTITAPVSVTETLNGGTISDSFTQTVTVGLTLTADAISALSDSFTAGPGANFVLNEAIYPLIESLFITTPAASSTQFLGIQEAIAQGLSDSFSLSIPVALIIAETGPSISDSAVRADIIPISLIDGISPGVTDTVSLGYAANLVLSDDLGLLTDTLLVSGSLIATLTISETIAPKSDGFTLQLGFVQFSSLGQEVFPFSAQQPATQAPNIANTPRLQFFPFAPTINPVSNTPSVSSPTQTVFPMTTEQGT